MAELVKNGIPPYHQYHDEQVNIALNDDQDYFCEKYLTPQFEVCFCILFLERMHQHKKHFYQVVRTK